MKVAEPVEDQIAESIFDHRFCLAGNDSNRGRDYARNDFFGELIPVVWFHGETNHREGDAIMADALSPFDVHRFLPAQL